MSEKRIYRVVFNHQGKIVELYARHVSQGGLFGFIEVEELIFGTRSQVVVDPSEESLKTEFQGVQRTFVPMHAILRIDEVEHEGVSRMRTLKEGETAAVHPFPMQLYTPAGPDKK